MKHFISERFETLCLAVSIKNIFSTFRSVSERFLSGIVETWSYTILYLSDIEILKMNICGRWDTFTGQWKGNFSTKFYRLY